MRLIPYTKIAGEWTLPDEIIASIWDRMMDEGTAKTVFCDGKIKNAGHLIEFFKKDKNLVHVVCDDTGNIEMVGWLNNFGDRTAQCHFNIFKRAWGRNSDELMKAVFRYWFNFKNDDGPVLDVIMGMIPAVNRLAIRFCKRIGVKFIGEIPNFTKDAYRGKRVGVAIGYVERKTHG